MLIVPSAAVQAQVEGFALLSARAASSVERTYSKKRSNEQYNRRVREGDGSSGISAADLLRVETADEVLLDRQRQSDIYANYKAVAYLSYVRGFLDVGEFLEYEEGDAAKRVVLYESLRLTNERILQPAFGELYDVVVARVRKLRDATTVNLVHGGDGDLDVSRGADLEKPLLQFKVHGSARNGFEPRFTLADTVKLRIKPVEQEILLEYSFGF